MALRNQPYIPLYVQDFLTDEKLMECSAAATGVYIRIMCILHKQEEYGVFLLKQKYKQTDKQTESTSLDFAKNLSKYLPYDTDEINNCLSELIREGVLLIDKDKLIQKRMVKDNEISIKRAEAGSKGGKRTQFAKANDKPNIQANIEANSENENEYENSLLKEEYKKDIIDEINNKPKRKPRKKQAIKTPPTLDEVKAYFKEKGYREDVAIRVFNYYDIADWHDKDGNKVVNWKQKIYANWFKEENKDKNSKISIKPTNGNIPKDALCRFKSYYTPTRSMQSTKGYYSLYLDAIKDAELYGYEKPELIEIL